jgi:hypothetical protein
MATRIHRVVLSLLIAGLVGHSAPAQAREDGAPASTLGIADAVRASATGAAGLYFNPAGIGLFRQYELQAGYAYSNDLESHGLSASAVDSATNEWLGMGSAYTFFISSGEEKREGHQVRGGLSTGYRGDNFSIFIGAAANYMTLTGDDSSQDVKYFTLDAGLLMDIVHMFRIGVSVQNLIDTTQARNGLTPAPRKIGMGAALTIDAFQLSFDAELDIQNPEEELPAAYRVGVQYLIQSMVVLRLGFAVDQGVEAIVRAREEDNYFLTGGAGYISREFSIEVGFQKSVLNDDGTVFAASFRYFLP